MKKLVIATVAASSLALGVAATPAHAQFGPGYGRPSYQPRHYVGSYYHPYYGYLTYFYYPSTGYAYFPALRSGLYVFGVGSGRSYPLIGGSPADRWLNGSEGGGGMSGVTVDPRGPRNSVYSLDGQVLNLPPY
jgi:hypothetical protein